MPVKNDVKLSTIGYIILYVADTEKALPFYRDILGLSEKFGEPGWREMETGGPTTLALHGCDKPLTERGEGTPIVVFNVDDIQGAYEALKGRGVKFSGEPKQVCEAGPGKVGLSADFKDPDGNLLSIFGYVTKK